MNQNEEFKDQKDVVHKKSKVSKEQINTIKNLVIAMKVTVKWNVNIKHVPRKRAHTTSFRSEPLGKIFQILLISWGKVERGDMLISSSCKKVCFIVSVVN